MSHYLIKQEINWFLLILLFGLWIVPVAYIPYVYGWQLGLGLVVAGLYHLLVSFESTKKSDYFKALALVFSASLVKTNYLIVFVALILVLGMRWIYYRYNLNILIKVMIAGVVMFAALQ